MLLEHFPDILFTEEKITEPCGKQYKGLFLNQLAVAYTKTKLDEVNEIAKEIEYLMGRLPEHKEQGIVKIDIDVFGWNNLIVRQEDFTRPYVQLLYPMLEELMEI